MDNPAQYLDLETTGYVVGDPSVATYWLDVSWRALRREVPSVTERLTSGDLDRSDVIDVIVSAALRVLRNPEGNESESGGIDDYTESWKRADPTMDVYFTSAEIRRLAPADPFVGGWAGSVKYV